MLWKGIKCHEKEVVSKGWEVTIEWVTFLRKNFNVKEESGIWYSGRRALQTDARELVQKPILGNKLGVFEGHKEGQNSKIIVRRGGDSKKWSKKRYTRAKSAEFYNPEYEDYYWFYILKKKILEACETSKQMSKKAIVEVWEGDGDGLG